MNTLHDNADDAVEMTMLALGGVSEQNAEYVLYAASEYLSWHEVLHCDEIDPKDLEGLHLNGLVPADYLLAQPEREAAPAPEGLPDEELFYNLFDYIEERLDGPVGWLEERLSPAERAPRIMRVIREVRREISVAAADLTAKARMLDYAARQELAPSTVSSREPSPATTAQVRPRPYQRLPVEAIHLIIAACTSLLDLQSLLYATRWRDPAAGSAPRLNFIYAGRLDPPTLFAEAWRAFTWFSSVVHFMTDAPLRNSVAPYMPAWNLLSAVVIMTVRERWAGKGYKFWRTLGALGEAIIPDFTVVDPTAEVVKHFCQQLRDPTLRLSFVRHEEVEGDNKVVKYDVVLELESGRVRTLRNVSAKFDVHVFNSVTFRDLTRLVLPDDIRPTALKALYNIKLAHVAELELVLDAGSERTFPFQPEATRLLQQDRDWNRPTLKVPKIRQLVVSSPTAMQIREMTIVPFMHSLGYGLPVDLRNVDLVYT